MNFVTLKIRNLTDTCRIQIRFRIYLDAFKTCTTVLREVTYFYELLETGQPNLKYKVMQNLIHNSRKVLHNFIS